MIKQVFENLDQWIGEQNAEARREGMPAIAKCEFKIVGQTALLEALLDLELAATADVDVLNNAEYSVLSKLNELLNVYGLEYDQLSKEIWMPKETRYADLYRGTWLLAMRAEPEFVMLSKAKKAFRKNKMLLRQYIALGPPESFFELCKSYQINLNNVLKE